jgi:hypothetical protein
MPRVVCKSVELLEQRIDNSIVLLHSQDQLSTLESLSSLPAKSAQLQVGQLVANAIHINLLHRLSICCTRRLCSLEDRARLLPHVIAHLRVPVSALTVLCRASPSFIFVIQWRMPFRWCARFRYLDIWRGSDTSVLFFMLTLQRVDRPWRSTLFVLCVLDVSPSSKMRWQKAMPAVSSPMSPSVMSCRLAESCFPCSVLSSFATTFSIMRITRYLRSSGTTQFPLCYPNIACSLCCLEF